MIHESMPVAQGQDTVHHGAVIARRRRELKGTSNQEIEFEKMRYSIPWLVVSREQLS